MSGFEALFATAATTASTAGTAAAATSAFSTLGTVLSAASTLIGVAGSLQQGAAAESAAKSQAQAAEYRAQVERQRAEALAQLMEQRAGQERAVSQRQAMEARREGRLVGSRAQAIAAASGGGALDPTIVDILAGIDTETEARALTALYGGEESARGLEHGAALERSGAAAFGAGQDFAAASARQAGEAARRSSFFKAGGRLFAGASDFADRFGRRRPSGTQLESSGGLFDNYAYG